MGCSLKAGVITIAIIYIVISVLNLGTLSRDLAKYHHGRHHRDEHHNGHDGEHHNGHHEEHHNRHHGDERHNGYDSEHHNGHHAEHHNRHHGGHHSGHHGEHHNGHHGGHHSGHHNGNHDGHYDRHHSEHHNGHHGGHHSGHHDEHDDRQHSERHEQHKQGKHDGHHKHHHNEDRDMTTTNSPHVAPVLYDDNKMLFGRDEKKLAFQREHMMETTAYPKMSDDDFDRQKKFCDKKPTLIIGIVFDLVTILSSCLVFAAVSDDVGKNQRRRHFLLPFIVWHLSGVVLFIAGGIYSLIKHRDHLPGIGHLILIIFVCLFIVGVLSTFIDIMVRYFKSLSISSGFVNWKMGDDDIEEQPLV